VLKYFNDEYIKRIQKLNSENEIENNIVYEIMQESKAKRRIQFSAIFYFSFYLFGATLISNHYGHSKAKRISLILFLYVPNIIFYNKKFKEKNSKIHEIVIRHSFSKIPITKDRQVIEKFIQEYLYFYNKNKLI
jgi:phenylacetate-coenzyme A ligase PaaK-like adenylate-forming protein